MCSCETNENIRALFEELEKDFLKRMLSIIVMLSLNDSYWLFHFLKKLIFHTRWKCSQKLIYTPVQIPFGIGDNTSKQIEIKLMYILWNNGLNGVDGRFPICYKAVIFKKQIM